jgi:hypothetical protein
MAASARTVARALSVNVAAEGQAMLRATACAVEHEMAPAHALARATAR